MLPVRFRFGRFLELMERPVLDNGFLPRYDGIAMTSEFILTTMKPEETRALGRALAPFLSPGTVLGLKGELGAGKTTLIQGICEGLGVSEKVVSPTFVLMHIYKGKIPIYHFDLYRLEPKDFPELGWDEFLESDGVGMLEWIDRAEGNFPFPHLEIAIDYGSAPDSRTFEFTPRGKSFPWLGELISRVSG